MTKIRKKRQKGKHSRHKQTGGWKEFLEKLGSFVISMRLPRCCIVNRCPILRNLQKNVRLT
jgi:hypothetical protein